ncbi:MAG: lysylphosphatidylglycerol synthase transmembrane domain-containing protein [Gaiellales bacterium]
MRRIPRRVRIALNVAISAAVIAYLVWQIDIGQTIDVIADTNVVYLALATLVFFASTWGMAWRWQLLLAARGVHEPMSWLTSMYFIGYAATQVLPTGIGGDAVRIVEHSRRRPGQGGEVAAAVLLERVIGAAGVLVMVGIGLIAAIGRYDDIRFLVTVELVSIVLVGAGLFLLFSTTARRHLRFMGPLTAKLRVERHARALYEAMHAYRQHPREVLVVLVVSVVLQFVRIISIWLCGLAVGIDLSLLPYVILGPLLFLAMMVPFTINGLGVREAFFVAFLGRFGVDPDTAFAAGFLFYAVTIAAAVPGAVLLLWRSTRPAVVGPRTEA